MTTPTLTVEELEVALAGMDSELPPPPQATPLASQAFVEPDQLKKDIAIDDNDLDTAVRHQAGLYLEYARLASRARHQYDNAKTTLDFLESKLSGLHRDAILAEGKKATEAAVEAAVKTDARWYQASKMVNNARLHFDLAMDARNAFDQRKDMLVQRAVDKRKDKEGDLYINGAKERNDASRHSVLAGIATASREA